MPSPFPGMNPYLEHRFVWPEFHDRYIVAIADVLTPQLVPRYLARMQQHLFVTDPTNPAREKSLGIPDLNVRPGVPSGGGPAGGAVVATAPITRTIPPLPEELTAAYIVIRSPSGNEVITVIELLSPSNQYAGEDREKYAVKRGLTFASNTSLVEIDLL